MPVTRIVRVTPRDHFTQVPNSAARDDRLSWRARGLLVWLLSHDDGWETSSEQMVKAGREGRDAVLTALRELVDAGYIVRRRWRDPATGQFRFQQSVHETPQPADGPDVDPARTGSPHPGNPASGKPAVIEDQQEDQQEGTRVERPTLDVAVARAVDVGFVDWWERYPRKLARKDARKAWDAAIRSAKANGHGPDVTRAMSAIAAGLDRWLIYWKAAETPIEFVPYPASWLRGDRFLEQPAAPTPVGPRGRPQPAPRVEGGALLAPGVG